MMHRSPLISRRCFCQDAPAFYALKADALGGDGTLEFSSLKGNVVLVTNVASK